LGKVTCTLEGAAETAGDDAGFMNAASALSEDLSHRRKTWQPAVCCIVITGEVGTTEKDINSCERPKFHREKIALCCHAPNWTAVFGLSFLFESEAENSCCIVANVSEKL
jgi:hypothetical protein